MATPIETLKAAFDRKYPDSGFKVAKNTKVPLLHTDMKKKVIGYNPKGLDKLTDEQLQQLGRHEAMHVQVYQTKYGS